MKYLISALLAHFGSHFEPPEAKIWYNQFLEMLKNVKNEFSRVENGVVGTKSSILALIVSEIPYFSPFGSHFEPTEAKIWCNQFLEMLKNVKNEFSRAENGVVGTKITP